MLCSDHGKEIQKRGNLCVGMADSLCCSTETLKSNYTPVKKHKSSCTKLIHNRFTGLCSILFMKKFCMSLYPYQLNSELAPFEESEKFKNTQFLLLALVVDIKMTESKQGEFYKGNINELNFHMLNYIFFYIYLCDMILCKYM